MINSFGISLFLSRLRTAWRHPVTRNAKALYVVYIVGMLLPLATAPFLARMLGPTTWGAVILIQSFAGWLSILMEYGFSLSATRRLARNRHELPRIQAIICGVQSAKLLLAMVVAALGVLFILVLPPLRHYPLLASLGLLLCLIQGANPIWYFQGVERLRKYAAVDVFSRSISVIAIFVFIRSPAQAWVVLAAQVGAVGVLVSWATITMYAETPAIALRVRFGLRYLRYGWTLFVFRAASSSYTVANSFLLGAVAPPAAVGYFGGADRIVRAELGLMDPLGQSLFPRMNTLVKNDPAVASRWALRGLIGVCVVTSLVAITTAALSPWLVTILLGEQFAPAAPVLAWLTLLFPLIGGSHLLGIQWMIPLGMDREFNRIIIGTAALHIGLALALALLLGAQGMAIAAVTTESLVTMTMLVVLWRRRRLPGMKMDHGSWSFNEI